MCLRGREKKVLSPESHFHTLSFVGFSNTSTAVIVRLTVVRLFAHECSQWLCQGQSIKETPRIVIPDAYLLTFLTQCNCLNLSVIHSNRPQ